MTTHDTTHARRRWPLYVGIPAAFVALLIAGSLLWALTPLGPGDEATSALVSNDGVRVERTEVGYEFLPQQARGNTGIIIYPGGRVDARSYATLARALADDDYLTIITPVTLSLAVLSPDAADRAVAKYPEVETWIIVGHSLGGAMAARYAHNNQQFIDGLVLLAAYPESAIDMTTDEIAVANLLGTRDTVVDRQTWTDGSDRLPADTHTVLIEGGNHAGFGDYGAQRGDSPAEISHARQVSYVIEAVRAILERDD